MRTGKSEHSLNAKGDLQGKVKKRFNQIEDSEKQSIINYVNRLLKEVETFHEVEDVLKRTIPFIRTVKAEREYREHYPHNKPIYENI